MSLKVREFCKSLNGDRWFLLYESDSGEVLVNQRPNAASGCPVSYFGGRIPVPNSLLP